MPHLKFEQFKDVAELRRNRVSLNGFVLSKEKQPIGLLATIGIEPIVDPRKLLALFALPDESGLQIDNPFASIKLCLLLVV